MALLASGQVSVPDDDNYYSAEHVLAASVTPFFDDAWEQTMTWRVNAEGSPAETTMQWITRTGIIAVSCLFNVNNAPTHDMTYAVWNSIITGTLTLPFNADNVFRVWYDGAGTIGFDLNGVNVATASNTPGHDKPDNMRMTFRRQGYTSIVKKLTIRPTGP